MVNHQKTFVIAAALIFSAHPLSAAPFCVQTQATAAECLYYDAAQCRTRAYELNGFCVANPGELVISPGGTGKYCLVLSSGQAQCLYADFTTCQNDAGPASGVCMEKSPQTTQDDPYKFDINRKY
jgi:hypothetical protein